jgi:serine/threonine protein kinase
VRGELVGPATDIYALGLVLLEALTGRREFPGMAVESATARLYRSPEVPAELPAGLGTVLTAMTRDDPRHRPSAHAVAVALAADPASPAAALGPAVPLPPRAVQHGRHRLGRPGSRAASRLALAAFIVAVASLSAAATPAPSPTPPAPFGSAAHATDPPQRIGLSARMR